jgi:hypothetical protein
MEAVKTILALTTPVNESAEKTIKAHASTYPLTFKEFRIRRFHISAPVTIRSTGASTKSFALLETIESCEIRAVCSPD